MSDLPRAGDVLRHKYRIEAILGQGGMAVVFAATHLHLQQRVALKVMRPGVARPAEATERFLREARATSRLQGSHVARLLDVDTLDDGTPFIVMELLEGHDLSALVSRQPVPIAEAVAHVRQACEGIAEAHALGIVHRDVKPANLFLVQRRGPDGGPAAPVIKVLDFGISKLLEDTRLTEEQVGMGSAEYMSPEQMRSARDVDARTDVWSLGVTLYELCTGRTPFHADGVGAVIAAVISRAPVPPRELRRDLPPGLEAVILRCLQKDPAARFGSVAELSAALAPFALPGAATALTGGLSAAAPGAAPAVPPVAAGVALGMVAVILGIVVFGLVRGRPGPPPRARFEVASDTVTDTQTKLTWQRRAAPSAMDWASAKAYCQRAKGNYRLPTLDELRSLLAVLAVEPPLDPESFGATPIDVFWSATADDTGAAKVVHFSTASVASSIVSTRNRVRCVR